MKLCANLSVMYSTQAQDMRRQLAREEQRGRGSQEGVEALRFKLISKQV